MADPDIEEEYGKDSDLLDMMETRGAPPSPEEESEVASLASGGPSFLDRMKLSKQTALLISLVIVVLIVVLGSYMVWQMSQPPVMPSPTPLLVTPSIAQSQTYNESALVDEYDVTSCPTLVFNCVVKKKGTYAVAETDGRVAPGTEGQIIINALCDASNKTVFCNQTYEVSVSTGITNTGRQPCQGEDGTVLVYAFHSPSCESSTEQRRILDQLLLEYPEEIEIRYICKHLNSGDAEACREAIGYGTYDE